jgi:hypothetical protein
VTLPVPVINPVAASILVADMVVRARSSWSEVALFA